MKAVWNSIFGGAVGASITSFVSMLLLSLVATDLAFGLIALWIFPFAACFGWLLGSQLQGHMDWTQTRPRSLRHWFVGGAATAISLFLAYLFSSLIREGYSVADMTDKLFSAIVLPLVLCSFTGVVGGSMGLMIGAIVYRLRRNARNSSQ